MTTTASAPDARAIPSHSGSPRTAVAPGWMTASFSRAIRSRVLPSTSVCSRSTFVRTTTGARRTFVASRRPPSPASTTATSTPAAANSASAAAVSTSNCVAPSASAAGRTRASAASRSTGSPFTCMRSAQPVDVRGRVRADGLAPRGEERLRSSASSSSSHSCRPRGSRGMRAGGPELGEEPPHPLQAELLRPGRERLDPRDVVSRAGHDAEFLTSEKRAGQGHREPAYWLKYAGDRGRRPAMLCSRSGTGARGRFG